MVFTIAMLRPVLRTYIPTLAVKRPSPTETQCKARAAGKYHNEHVFNHARFFITTILSSYLMRRTRSGSPAGDVQPITYQAPAFDSDSDARQAFLSMCAAGFPTTCSVSGNPSNGIPFFSAYPCYLSKSVQAVPKVSCVIIRLSQDIGYVF
jgi:hypothetical protein